MKFGMTAEQYALLERLVVQPLKDHGAEVFIFGSRVTGKHHSHSDVDILFRLPANEVLTAGKLSTIKEDIEQSRFPFAVDLVADEDLANAYRSHVMANMKKI